MGVLRDALIEAAKVRSRAVKIGDLDVNVREVSAAEFAEYGVAMQKDRRTATAKLIGACVVDDAGARVLDDADAALVAESARMALPIVSAILDLSGFGEKESDAS